MDERLSAKERDRIANTNMTPANVSSSILTIITSFANGLEVLQKLKNSKRKGTAWSKASKRSQDEQLRLSRSLRRGMNDIGREYQEASTHCDGERFAVGDGMSLRANGNPTGRSS